MEIETWRSDLHRSALDVYIARAVTRIVENPPEPGTIIPRVWLMTKAGFPELPGDATEDHQTRWQLASFRFFAAWRQQVLTALGRYPKTVTGKGFDLLSPEETMSTAITEGYDLAERALSRAGNMLAAVKESDLSADQRQAQRDELVLLGRHRQMMERERDRAMRAFPPPVRVPELTDNDGE